MAVLHFAGPWSRVMTRQGIRRCVARSLHFVLLVAVLAGPIGSIPAGAADEKPKGPPLAKDLQSGDFLWPKKQGEMIPYDASLKASNDADERRWLRERDEYVTALRASSSLSTDERQRLRILEGMSYKKFLGVFADEESPEGPTQFGGWAGVGHVAVVRIHDSKVTVVEALWRIGVREISYDQWSAERRDEWVWLGRLSDTPPEKRAEVAERAATQVGKPYKFWDFNLADESGFYCSKLVWLATLQATNVALDDKSDPRRFLWLSPKQLLRSSNHLIIVQNPGNYSH